MAEQFVDEAIRSCKVVVFSKTYCPYCVKAKDALANYSLDDQIRVIELEDLPFCSEIQRYLKKLTGASSVPRVFINGKFIGGGDDTARLHKNGQLRKILSQ